MIISFNDLDGQKGVHGERVRLPIKSTYAVDMETRIVHFNANTLVPMMEIQNISFNSIHSG